LRVNYAQAIFDEEINDICEFMKSGKQIAYGEYAIKTEKKLSDFLGVNHTLLVNSGSSANMLAFMVLTSHQLEEARIKPGDEVITTACGFPTTISPIVNYGCIPVFIDIDETLNIDVIQIEKMVSDKTKAIMIAHTLGNPFNVEAVQKICDKYNLWLIEDNCDALGAKYKGQHTGAFGDIATSSFYPAHHITCGEGGAVYINDKELYRIAQSMRDWGRDYKCDVCKPDCKNRFKDGYDCRYQYSHFGFNLKITELQAILLNRQIDKLPGFIEKRKQNWNILRQQLSKYFNEFQKQTEHSEPSWFTFYIADIERNKIVEYLEKNGIGARVLFAGNILKHKCMEGVPYRSNGWLSMSDHVMTDGFFIGCAPHIGVEEIDYIIQVIDEYKN